MQSNTTRVKFNIVKDINHLLNTAYPYIECPNNWNSLIEMVVSYKHAIMVKEVTWEKPQQPFLNLNTDGSALNNPAKIGRGGIVRYYQGNMIYAFNIPLGTNNQAEIQAVSHGLD